MTAFTDKLNRAAGAATCSVLADGGRALIGAGVVGLAGGGVGIAPLTVGVAGVMASNYLGCSGWDPNQGNPTPPPSPIRCEEGNSYFRLDGYKNGVLDTLGSPIQRITNQTVIPIGNPGGEGFEDRVIVRVDYVDPLGGTNQTNRFSGTDNDGNVYTIVQVWEGDDTCLVPTPPIPPVSIPPFNYTDTDGCELTVNFQGFASVAGGNANPVFKIEPNAESLRVSDVIGGCNFQPVIYMSDPNGGPPYVNPWNPDWDLPGAPPYQWGDDLKDTANIPSTADVIDLIEEVIVDPFEGVVYAINSICELDAAGNPETKTVETVIPPLSPLVSIANRLDALVPILQAQKDFKQPVCPPTPLSGDFRTISFKSDTVSPNGKSRLLKRLKYRSVSGIDLDALIDYWKDFVFEAGPVTVKHCGASWGTVTVWAASSAEGKRVIRFAASEAGIDPDQVGYWEIGGSSSTRLGMPGTMRVNTSGGYYWITERDGPTERPLVGQT